MFRVADKNVARKENQEECVAPTTARSPGRPPGCALMVASDRRSSFATNLVVGQTFPSVPLCLLADRKECLSYFNGRLPRCSAAIPPVKFS